MVQFGTRSRPIDLDFVPDAQVGDYVLVQGGFAVTQIDEKEAKRRMGEITTSGELEGEGITLDAALDDDLELERRQKPHPKS
jgi:hydrogenase expression/formation protein HypC